MIKLAQADDSPPEVVERWLLEVPLSTASGGEGVGAPYEAATDLHRVWASLALTDYYYMYSVLQVESTLVCTGESATCITLRALQVSR